MSRLLVLVQFEAKLYHYQTIVLIIAGWFAFCIDQNVPWLDVPMQNSVLMRVMLTPLVHEELRRLAHHYMGGESV